MLKWREVRDLPLVGRPSALGILIGALLFAASLTPSLIPRAGLVQGVLGGICFAIGYLVGWILVQVYVWAVEAGPAPRDKQMRRLYICIALGMLVGGYALANVTEWQNGIHRVMGIAPVESARPFTIFFTAAGLALGLVLLGRLFRRAWRIAAAQLESFIPRRLALLAGLALALLLFWSVGNDMVVGRILALLDKTYARVDALIPSDQAAPSEPWRTGSPASLVEWESLGAEGRNWILGPPDRSQIEGVTQAPAKDPLRIYVGLNSAEDAVSRADLALREAIRMGAFERRYLVVATPTGTGWMDAAGTEPLDYLTGGDVAVVGVQYSYLPSWMSLILQPEYGAETAMAVFAAFHSHWHELPEATRPKLYLFGLSLGARNGELAMAMPETLGDPVQGALWVGPPFAAQSWRQVLGGRRADSPAWAPQFRDGSVVRVSTQEHLLHQAKKDWGPLRIVYLAYPSDPIAFFAPDVIWRRPDWLSGARAPDVSPGLRWFPIVTFLQLGFDMMTATTTPMGYGHVYAGKDYLYGWAEVLGLGLNETRGAREAEGVASDGTAADVAARRALLERIRAVVP